MLLYHKKLTLILQQKVVLRHYFQAYMFVFCSFYLSAFDTSADAEFYLYSSISAVPTQMRVPAVQYKHVRNKTSAQKAKNLRAKQTRQENWQGKRRLKTPISHCATEAQGYDLTLVNGSNVLSLRYIGIGLHFT